MAGRSEAQRNQASLHRKLAGHVEELLRLGVERGNRLAIVLRSEEKHILRCCCFCGSAYSFFGGRVAHAETGVGRR